jgi:hypothetical protein
MTAPKDPGPRAGAEKLHEQLSTLIRAIKRLRKWHPELAERTRLVIEPLLDAEQKKRESAYFAYLFKLQTTRDAPLTVIEPASNDPKLCKLKEKREIAAEIAHLFRWLL